MTGRAAGGLLWRYDGEPRLAVVHRPRYDDWSLPKGKLESGESWAEAAVREVVEETGCQVEPGSFVGTTRYTVDGEPKEVRFWHMTVVESGVRDRDGEVDELVWLTPEDAVARLSYANERALVADAESPVHD